MADNEDPILALTHQFSEFIKTSDERFKQLEAKMEKTACSADEEEQKKLEAAKKKKDGEADPALDGDGPKAFAAIQNGIKMLQSQVEALGKVHKFATPPAASPADDAAQKKRDEDANKTKELGFVVKVREFMTTGSKLTKLDAIRKAATEHPDLHKEFTSSGADGQKALRTL